jgi:hypothetical protein
VLPSTPETEAFENSPEQEAFRKFARLTALKKDLNAKLREIEPQLRALEPVLLGYLGQNGIEKIQVDGFSMAPAREPWIYAMTGISRRTVCEALKLSGLGRFVTENYSTRSLTAYVRELEEHNALVAGADPDALRQLLPDALAKVLEVRPGFKLKVYDRRKNAPAFDFEVTEEGEDNDNPE